MSPSALQIPGLDGWWCEAKVTYTYAEDPVHCPVCGGVGWVWRGWLSCDGTCGAKALVAEGRVFVPVTVHTIPAKKEALHAD